MICLLDHCMYTKLISSHLYKAKLHLSMLQKSKIWAINLGENFRISLAAWQMFAREVAKTKIAFMFAEMDQFPLKDIKRELRATIAETRRCPS